MERVDYGNWVAARLVYGFGAASLLFFGLAAVWLPSIALGAVLAGIGGYFAYARRRFSPSGGDLQIRILGLVLERLEWSGQGQALDIGCGNGALSIRLALRYPDARVTGIDSWGAGWEYSQRACERNAELEGVGGRVRFLKASASALPFADESYDVAVSNLVFHEVRDSRDKRQVMQEALRVVKRGGRFAFQDLFEMRPMFGQMEELLAAIRGWGVAQVSYMRTSDEPFIPRLLKLPFMVGTIGIIWGVK